jgi:HEAT repeat protein
MITLTSFSGIGQRQQALMVWFLISVVIISGAQQTEMQKRLDILNFGIESQVIELLDTLKKEQNAELADQVLEIAATVTSPRLKTAIIEYFRALRSFNAINLAVSIIAARDETTPSLVGVAFSYLVDLKSDAALQYARRIIDDDERRYLLAAIKTVGVAGDGSDAERLRIFYESANATAEIRQEILLAFGKMKDPASFGLLADIVVSEDAGKVERMHAATALGDLADPRSIPVLITASTGNDPNVRAHALSALQKYADPNAMNAILQGLRDQHVIPRTAAVKATGMAGLADAIPFLEFRVSTDPERSVRDAALDALASIGGERSMAFLASYIDDDKQPINQRSRAFSVLLAHGSPEYIDRLMLVLQRYAADKDRSIFNAFAKAALATDHSNATAAARLLMNDNDHTTRLGAIAWTDRTRAIDLIEHLRSLAASDPVEAVRRRATAALERLESR